MYDKNNLIKIDCDFSIEFNQIHYRKNKIVFKSLNISDTKIDNFFTANNIITCLSSFTKNQLNIVTEYQIENILFSVVCKHKQYFLKILIFNHTEWLEDSTCLFLDKFEVNCIVNNLNRFFCKFDPILSTVEK